MCSRSCWWRNLSSFRIQPAAITNTDSIAKALRESVERYDSEILSLRQKNIRSHSTKKKLLNYKKIGLPTKRIGHKTYAENLVDKERKLIVKELPKWKKNK